MPIHSRELILLERICSNMEPKTINDDLIDMMYKHLEMYEWLDEHRAKIKELKDSIENINKNLQ